MISFLYDTHEETAGIEVTEKNKYLNNGVDEMIEIKKHTEGDTRVAKEIPTISAFHIANSDHVEDVKNLARFFAEELVIRVQNHDWTKLKEPYRSMFYRDLCDVMEGRMDFFEGEWSKLHYNKLERHHIKEHCPDDVNMLDVIEMICDCVAAGLARSGDIYDLDIPSDVLHKAVANTVDLLKKEVHVID